MQSEITNNPEVKTPFRTGMKTRSQYRMSQQSHAEIKTQNGTPVVAQLTARTEHHIDSKETGSKASHNFSQESIQAIIEFDGKIPDAIE